MLSRKTKGITAAVLLVRAAIVLAAIGVAHADDFIFDKPKSNWTPGSTWREVGFQGLLMLDLAQTRGCLAAHTCIEQNPILGPHPGTAKLNATVLITSIAHIGIANALPEKYCSIFQYSTIAIEGIVVGRSYHFGFRAKF